ncbi:unnamed protein product, partial [Ectocarpus sp. 8 AP-2014]
DSRDGTHALKLSGRAPGVSQQGWTDKPAAASALEADTPMFRAHFEKDASFVVQSFYRTIAACRPDFSTRGGAAALLSERGRLITPMMRVAYTPAARQSPGDERTLRSPHESASGTC